MTKDDDTFFFIKNLQGDVTKIIDEDGEICATYAYDAWGALLAQNEDSSIEGLNPFRYRGYVYDTETQLYYLQSRYYDPKTGRFINADDPAYNDTVSGSPLSTNMFAYCENNAPNEEDPSGNWHYLTIPMSFLVDGIIVIVWRQSELCVFWTYDFGCTSFLIL